MTFKLVVHMVWLEKLKEYGVDEATVNEWAAKNYPRYASNRELMAKLYLALVKGIKVAEPRIAGEFTTISELTVGKTERIRVVVIQHVEKRAYVGCPKCMKKLQAAPNTTVECPRDGLVRAQVLEWNLVLVGDNTGEIMLTIPPSIGRVPNPGEEIAVEGMLTEQEEFFVYRYSTAEAEPVSVEVPAVSATVTPTTAQAVTTTPPTPPPVTVTPQAPTVTVTEAIFKCPVCNKVFKNKLGLSVHVKTAHKERSEETTPKPAEAPKPEVKPVEAVEAKPAEVKPSLPEEAVKFARVAAAINKPVEEFKAWIATKFPEIDIDELFKAAGVKVEGGVMKKVAAA